MKSNSKAILTLLALGLAACQAGDSVGVQGSRVQFQLSSGGAAAAPGAALSPATSGGEHGRNPFFRSANVTFSSILARNVEGQLIDTGMDLPATVDVVAMDEGGRTVTLPDGTLPVGTYDQIVVVMTAVEGVLRDGTGIAITPPGGGWTAIVPVCPFDVEEGSTAIVGLMLPVRTAFIWGEGRFRFEPRFRSRLRCDAVPEPDPETDTDTTDGVTS